MQIGKQVNHQTPPDTGTSGSVFSVIDDFGGAGVSGPGLMFPNIIVIGDKGSGKSSLIGALLEITLPRDPGGRCITQINLRDGPNWLCKVSLITKYDYSPGTEPNPWVKRDWQIDTVFETVKNKTELVDTIRLAQIAALNPRKNPKEYVHAGDKVDNASAQVSFSPNIVSLEIAAPGLPEVSFHELPGIISQSHDGRNDTVDLIKSFASGYIGQEDAVVLLTVPMGLPISNSVASALLKEQSATRRTIGVLTKPDQLSPDQPLDSLKSVLQGESFKMGRGYYVVKQPSQKELDDGITHSQARANEESFFTKDWMANFGSNFQDRCGTRNLETALLAIINRGPLDC